MTGHDPAAVQDFLHFMAARYDTERNEREGSLIWSVAQLRGGERVLDVACGWGRIAAYLTERAVEVVGVDIDETMIEMARGNAPRAEFHVRDMRDLDGLGQFDAALIWWSSFGVFDDEVDRGILRQIRALLKPGGRLVLETAGGSRMYSEAAANPNGKTISMVIGPEVMIDHRTISPCGRRIVGSRKMFRNARVTEMPYSVRIFTASELEYWLLTCGFSKVDLFDLKQNSLQWQSANMVAVAHV